MNPGLRTLLLATACVAIAACSGPAGTPTPDLDLPVRLEATPAAPVVLVSVDTLRADHLGAYGYGPPTSPAIDRFSRTAIVFEQAVAQAPSTLHSHASLLASLLPHHHGASWSRRQPLRADVPTLAEALASAGYSTGAFTGGGQVAAEFGLDRGFDVYRVADGPDGLVQVVAAAFEWTDAAIEEGRPFFLFLHTYQVHHPYTPSDEDLSRFDPDYEGPLPDHVSKDLLADINSGEVEIGPADLAHVIATYDAEIRAMDRGFDALLDGLRTRGLLERSLVVLTSDHGEEFGEHGRVGWHSHSLYDELLLVPLVVKLPGTELAGTRVPSQVRGVDVAPTILGSVGVSVPATFAGVDLLGGAAVPGFSISRQDTPAGLDRSSVRTPHFKLYPADLVPAGGPRPTLLDRAWRKLRPSAPTFVLFDLDANPAETQNVAGSERSVLRELRTVLDREVASQSPPPERPPIVTDHETRERLEALGYLENSPGVTP